MIPEGIRELIEKAYPLPWKPHAVSSIEDAVGRYIAHVTYRDDYAPDAETNIILNERTRELIITAVNNLPDMLAKIQELEELLEEARIWQSRFANDSEAYKQGRLDEYYRIDKELREADKGDLHMSWSGLIEKIKKGMQE